MKFDKEIEKKIQEALESGAFENLPGMGEPLVLDHNPHEDPSWALAFRLLKSNEFTLPWVEKRRTIEKQVEAARSPLRRAWNKNQKLGGKPPTTTAEWDRAVAGFRERLEDINRQIRSYNLGVPLDQLQMLVLDPDREIVAIKGTSDPDSSGAETLGE